MPINQIENVAFKSSDAIDRIMAHHTKFLSFLAARVEDKTESEDILQSAYIKAIEHGSEIREEENSQSAAFEPAHHEQNLAKPFLRIHL